ncbi:MAG: branched-chain amino acid ABC transporter permease [Syntrophales bacterium]|nr:branched-chain amino acid ABC transporter permease [Syntrophales bacterium]
MDLLFQQTLNGIMVGSVYALVALGLTLEYGILHIPNFAHGVLYTLGAYLTFLAVAALGYNYWLAMACAMLVLAVMGIVIDRLVYQPLIAAPHLNSFIAAIGLIYIFKAGMLIIWGPDFKRFPPINEEVINFFGATVTIQRIIIVLVTAVLIVLLNLFIKKTMAGMSIEALAQDREGALLAGINVKRVETMVFAVGSAMAAVAAALISPIFLVYNTMGDAVILKAFVIIILGGMGSIPGAVIGGYIIGLIESLGGAYLSTDYNEIVAFAILIGVLAVKPTGLFGTRAH